MRIKERRELSEVEINEPWWYIFYDTVIGVLLYPILVWPYLYWRLTGKIRGGRWVGKKKTIS